jgi:hypothetical protein
LVTRWCKTGVKKKIRWIKDCSNRWHQGIIWISTNWFTIGGLLFPWGWVISKAFFANQRDG